MIIADSNLIIYAANLDYDWLVAWFETVEPSVSRISYVEALGFHGLRPEEKRKLELFFGAAKFVEVSEEVAVKAARLRQKKKMKLGDSLIAATALAHGLTLATHNTADFAWITDLSVIDPFDQQTKSQSNEGASL